MSRRAPRPLPERPERWSGPFLVANGWASRRAGGSGGRRPMASVGLSRL